MPIRYARVSTEEEDTRLQFDALSSAGYERIYQEVPSGSNRERPELAKCLDALRNGDTLTVWLGAGGSMAPAAGGKLREGGNAVAKLSDVAQRLLSQAMEGKQGVQGNREIVRTNYDPSPFKPVGNKEFTITAGGDYFYEQKPETEDRVAQASAAVDELYAAGLIQVVSESPDKRKQRFDITLKGIGVYDKLKNPTQWVGRREE